MGVKRRRLVAMVAASIFVVGCASSSPLNASTSAPASGPIPSVSEGYAFCEPKNGPAIAALEQTGAAAGRDTATADDLLNATLVARQAISDLGDNSSPYFFECSSVHFATTKAYLKFAEVLDIWRGACPNATKGDCPTQQAVQIVLGLGDANTATGEARDKLEQMR